MENANKFGIKFCGEQLRLVGPEILEVLYSPVKAFKKIIEKPDFKGVLLVLLLVIASALAVQYVAGSKQILETRTPEDEIWTEELMGQHAWTSNGVPSLDAAIYQIGNNSITSSVVGTTNFWLKLADFDPINCSETGYIEVFFWINWNNEAGASPTSGTLTLFSGSEDSYFETDLESLLPSNTEWGNITLDVGPNQGWSSSNSPDWQNITAVEFELVWSDSANLAMNIDGLFFRSFASSIERGTIYIEFLSVALQVGITWVIWAGLLIIVAKLFNEDLGKWNTFFIIIGYVFMVTFVTNIVTAVLASTLPELTYLLDPTATYYYARNSDLWVSNVAFQLLTPVLWIGYIWTTALSAIVIRQMKDLPWGKALTIAVIAFVARILLSAFGF